MFSYIAGNVIEVGIDRIVLDCNGIGYEIMVAHPDNFSKNQQIKVNVFMHVKEDDIALYGFESKEEKSMFLRLINVNGIGPKTAINMMSQTTTKSLIQAIETSNTTYLKKLPGIGPKAAQQIILDLKGKLVFDNYDNNIKPLINNSFEDAKDGLKSLGFKASEIDGAFSKITDKNLSSEEILKLALKLLKR